ncbi:MAG: SRPBCC family protein [Actinobacteria bacterium]|nr:SRPBCC family protein [Actinomycetota bacterium]
MSTTAQLPTVDEHEITVAAPVDTVWRAVLDALDRGFSGTGAAAYARVVGCEPSTASGPRPLAEGSTMPGFRVVGADHGRRLTLEGRHRFSTYALVFHVDPLDAGRCRVRAESRAAFPGPAGAAYRLLVVGTGGHAVAVRRLLRGIGRRAEQQAGAARA